MCKKYLKHRIFLIVAFVCNAGFYSLSQNNKQLNDQQKNYELHKNNMQQKYNQYLSLQRNSYTEYLKDINSKYAQYFIQLKQFETQLKLQNKAFRLDYEKGEVELTITVSKDLLENTDDLAKELVEGISTLDNILETNIDSKTSVSIITKQIGTNAQRKVEIEGIVGSKEYKISPSEVNTNDVSVSITYKMMPDHIRTRSEQFLPLVEKYSKQHNVDKHLVMGIIHTESYFNPYALSNANACGLMQIVPGYAGIEVSRRYNEPSPSPAFLFVPDNNIRYGCKYIQILDEYFADITDKTKREYCIVASYNGGHATLSNIFGASKHEAINKINSLSEKEVYRTIANHHPYAETRNYFKQVIDRKKSYQSWMG